MIMTMSRLIGMGGGWVLAGFGDLQPVLIDFVKFDGIHDVFSLNTSVISK